MSDQERKRQESLPERPLECSECKKKITVKYTEIVQAGMTHTSMCSDCPQLELRLHGTEVIPAEPGSLKATDAGLLCGGCGTSLANIRMGAPLGCANCYDVFGTILIEELAKTKKVPEKLIRSIGKQPFHKGKITGETTELSPSLRLLSLNEALSETLSREDYEQAAWLRDQIKELEGKQGENQ